MSKKLTEIFVTEIESLDSPLKEHVIELLNTSPQYITEIPSSTTGKYHPNDELGADGMIKHITKIIAFVYEIVRIEDYKKEELDLLLSAALLHDAFKCGKTKGKYTVKNHAELIYNHIKKYIKNTDLIQQDVDKLEMLALICVKHAGRWSTDREKSIIVKANPSQHVLNICKSFHYADCLASKRSIYEVMQGKAVTPIDNNWTEKQKKFIKKIIGFKLEKIIDDGNKLVEQFNKDGYITKDYASDFISKFKTTYPNYRG